MGPLGPFGGPRGRALGASGPQGPANKIMRISHKYDIFKSPKKMGLFQKIYGPGPWPLFRPLVGPRGPGPRGGRA